MGFLSVQKSVTFNLERRNYNSLYFALFHRTR